MDQSTSQVSRAGVMASATEYARPAPQTAPQHLEHPGEALTALATAAAECANATTEFMLARERKQSADAALYEAEQRVKNAREQHSV